MVTGEPFTEVMAVRGRERSRERREQSKREFAKPAENCAL